MQIEREEGQAFQDAVNCHICGYEKYTDSLCYEITTDDVHQDMLQDIDLFDISEYKQSHALYSLTNKKVLGKMKDETHGIPIQEFVGLRPKMYSILYTENDKLVEKKTAKGIKK